MLNKVNSNATSEAVISEVAIIYVMLENDALQEDGIIQQPHELLKHFWHDFLCSTMNNGLNIRLKGHWKDL